MAVIALLDDKCCSALLGGGHDGDGLMASDGVFAFDGWRGGTIVMDFIEGVGTGEGIAGTVSVVVAAAGAGVGASAGAWAGAVEAEAYVDGAGEVVGAWYDGSIRDGILNSSGGT